MVGNSTTSSKTTVFPIYREIQALQITSFGVWGDWQHHEHVPLMMSSHFSSHIRGLPGILYFTKGVSYILSGMKVHFALVFWHRYHQGFWKSSESKIKVKVIKSWVERLRPRAKFCQSRVFALYLIAFIKTPVFAFFFF